MASTTTEDNGKDVTFSEAQPEEIEPEHSIQVDEAGMPIGRGPDGRSMRSRQQSMMQKSAFMRGKIPTDFQEREEAIEKHGSDSWQTKILGFIHSGPVQAFLMTLLMADVVILFIELFLFAEFPDCKIIQRDAISCCAAEDSNHTSDNSHHILRFLAGGNDDEHHSVCEKGIESAYPAACDEHKYEDVHAAHKVLLSFTLFILSTFLLELITLMFILGLKGFFSKFFYVLDLVIVSVSMALELTFLKSDLTGVEAVAGIILISRVWRFVRIGHGIFETTHELTSRKAEHLEEYIEELEDYIRKKGIKVPETRTAEAVEKLSHSDGA